MAVAAVLVDDAPPSVALDPQAVDLLVVHHTVADVKGRTPDEYMADLDASVRRTRCMAGVPYHVVVFADGSVRQGREWDVRGAHATGYNSRSYGFAFAGNMSAQMPTRIAQSAMAAQLALKAYELGLTEGDVKGHGELPGVVKDCPGRYVCMALVRASVARELRRLAGAAPTQP